MKYVLAVLFVFNAFASPAKADACQESITRFLIAIAADKKEDALNLVVPASPLYLDIRDDREKTYSSKIKDRFATFQFDYNNTFVVTPIEELSTGDRCAMKIHAIDGGERVLVATTDVLKSNNLISRIVFEIPPSKRPSLELFR